jgi:hypothetical protein
MRETIGVGDFGEAARRPGGPSVAWVSIVASAAPPL